MECRDVRSPLHASFGCVVLRNVVNKPLPGQEPPSETVNSSIGVTSLDVAVSAVSNARLRRIEIQVKPLT
jgi:hypothetical protein